MSYTVSFHRDKDLYHNVKYRNSYPIGAEWTGQVVDIGNFSNKNLYQDNSVSVGIGRINPNIGNYQLITNCNVIKIIWDGKIVIGHITDWLYINDTNVSVSYNVDAFTSAMANSWIETIDGICERVNLLPVKMLSNDQGEPFSPSDLTVANPNLTASLNNFVQSFEGVTISSDGTQAGGTCFVLTVSSIIDEYCGGLGAWASNANVVTKMLRVKSSLSFFGKATTRHSGGVFVGIPYKFSSIQNVERFITGILGGCGFITKLTADGVEGQSATSYRQYIVNSNTSGGQVYNETKNDAGDPMEAIRFITDSDIFNLYCIPEQFASDGMKHSQSFIRGMKTLNNLSSHGHMSQRHNKLLCYPYYYNKLKTANGDDVQVIPQTHWLDIDSPFPDPRLWLYLRFVGGDTPRIMANFAVRKNEAISPTSPSFVGDWFTVRNYPSLPINIENSYNQQIQNDVSNNRQVSAVHANKQTSRQISNPIKQGYLDSVTGSKNNGNTAQNHFQRMGTVFGKGLGAVSEIGSSFGFADGTNGTGVFSDEASLDAWSMQRSNEAGNIVGTNNSVRMGNSFMTQFSIPAFASYDCGGSDTELFVFARFLEEFGASCGCYLDPITNNGNIFNADATVESINGRTFYQYANIQIKGFMPIEWKQNIKNLFETGVYLLD